MPAPRMRAFSFHNNHLPHFLLGRIKSVAFCDTEGTVVPLKNLTSRVCGFGRGQDRSSAQPRAKGCGGCFRTKTIHHSFRQGVEI